MRTQAASPGAAKIAGIIAIAIAHAPVLGIEYPPAPTAAAQTSSDRPAEVQQKNGDAPQAARAKELRELGQVDAARALLEAAVREQPRNAALRAAWIEEALAARQPATALRRWREAPEPTRGAPSLRLFAAQAYLALDQAAGRSTVRRVEGGRLGQFRDGWLLLERRDGHQRFWCCPEESGMYQLRRALDDGLDDPEAHLLHARMWRAIGRPATAWAIFAAREADLLDAADDAALAELIDTALELGRVADGLRIVKLRAGRSGPDADAVLAEGYLRAADHYASAGDVPLHADMLERAVDKRPRDAALRVRAGDAAWTAGRTSAAAAHYEAAITLDAALRSEPRIVERLAAWHDDPRP